MLKFISSLFSMSEKIADTEKAIIEHRAENEIIKDKHNYKKAVDIAEKIIMITQKYEKWFKPYDRRMLEKLLQQFNKYN